ncbi:putative membrane protein [Rhodococcus sp. MTM3W5.2]|uniref:DUF3488 domain-containing protein n=1 Tax=Rhodococcus sp. MTM3W5.2 TaxID=1805827 RepID=UPI00097983D8|nr:DUF3488 domain-containing protein [Rhodococcus sp. MTM3W5.2]AQA20667.1 putative membrane protein [Rhodococcus sp. MTM3W5.2]
MNRRWVTVLDSAAAFLVATTAGWALIAPVAEQSGIAGSESQLRLVLTSRPLAATLGVVLAVAVAGAMARRGSRAGAYLVAVSGLTVLGLGALVNVHVHHLESGIALIYLAGIGAGLAMGGAATVAADRYTAVALAAGAFAAFMLAYPAAHPTVESSSFGWTAYSLPISEAAMFTDPPWWLLLPALGCCVAGAVLARGSATEPAGSSRRPLYAVAIVVVTGVASNAVLAEHRNDWSVAAPMLALLLVAIVIAAFLLDGRDGVFLLTATAVLAASAPLLVATGPDPIWIAILLTLLVAGAAVGSRWAKPTLGLVLLAVNAAAGLAGLNDAWAVEGIRYLALAPIAGYALASAVPRCAASIPVGLSVLFVPSALTIAGQGEGNWHWDTLSVFDDLPRGIFEPMPPDPFALSLAMTLVILGCAEAVHRLRQRDPSPSP